MALAAAPVFLSRRSRRRKAQCTPCASLVRPLVCTVHACTHAPEKIPRVRACVFVYVSIFLPSVRVPAYGAYVSSSFNRFTSLCMRLYDTRCASMLTSVIWRETPRQQRATRLSFYMALRSLAAGPIIVFSPIYPLTSFPVPSKTSTEFRLMGFAQLSILPPGGCFLCSSLLQ